MYKVSQEISPKYGNVIIITCEEQGIKLPFDAMQQALKSRRLWRDSGTTKIRLLVDGQIMTTSQLERWAHEEYQTLPKCAYCASLLDGEVYTHQLCGNNLFCQQSCADQDYHTQAERIMDEIEIDYL